jgi:hypothetical protein
MANESELSLPNLGEQDVEYGANGTLDAPVSVKNAAATCRSRSRPFSAIPAWRSAIS